MEQEIDNVKSYWRMHRFMLLVIMTITTAVVLVSISMSLYISSGTIQLDLSRPGYQEVSGLTDSSTKQVENFSETGKLDTNSLNEFDSLYKKQADKSKAVDAFGGDPLEPTAAGLLQPVQ